MKASLILMICILVGLLSWLNSIVRWVSNVSQGKEDTRQTLIKAKFVESGTVGVATESGSLEVLKS